MKKNIQESFVAKTSKKRATDIVPKKLELDEQSFFSLIHEYTDSLGIKNFNKGDIVDTKSENGHEKPIIVQKEVKRYYKPETASVGSFAVSLVISPYSYFLGRATEIPVFDLKFKVLFYPNENNVRIGIYVNDFKADCCRKKRVSYEVFIPRHFFRKSDGRFLDKGFDFFYQPKKFLELTKMGIDTDTLEICKNYIKHIADFKIETEKDADVLDLSNESLKDVVTKVQSVFGTELFHLEENVFFESFTKKISSKKNTDLVPDIEYPDGVYILHETLGVKDVEGWNPKDNEGVVGILLIEDDHKIVIALEDSPENLCWSKKEKLVNRPIENTEDAESDFNGEEYRRNLNSPDFPAAYYCLNYKKGGRSWYLPSSGELWLIYRHIEEVQTALSIVGGKKFVTEWVDENDAPRYWSSTEDGGARNAWHLLFDIGDISYGASKVYSIHKVRPISKFQLSELKESFVKKTRNTNSAKIVQDADDKAFNPLIDAKEFINRLEECILSYKQPYVYGKKNPYNLEKFSFEMITSWPNTFKFNRQIYHSSELLFDVSNSKKPSFRIKLIFFELTRNIICYLTVTPAKPNKEGIYEDRLFQYIYDSKKKRISFVENPEGVRFDDNMESIEPTLRNLNFILNDIRFLMDNWKIFYKTYLKKNSFETWNEFYKMLPSQNNKGFDFDLKESFVHKISKKTTDSLKGGEMFGEMESFGEFDMLFKRFLKKHEHQFSSCFTTNYPFKSMAGKIGYKVVLKKDCPFEDGSDDRTVLRFSLDVFQGDIMNFPEDQELNTPHGILTVAFYTELGPSTPQQINLANLEFIGGNESPVDFRFVKFKERREWEKPNFSYQLLFGLERFLLALVETMNNMDEQTWSEIGRTSANFNPFKGEACCGADSKIILGILEKHEFYSELHKNFSKVNLTDLNESFTKKISSKKNTDLISRADSDFVPEGVYILHKSLGVKTVDSWNPKDNDGVVGILLIEDDHKIVIALEDSPKELRWSEERKLVNQPIKDKKDAESDFNGEEYCRNLNSPFYPAAYYCLNYNKGGRNWYLPSFGELWLIYRHFEEVQNALSIVGGQKFITEWDVERGSGLWYWSSTEDDDCNAWELNLGDGSIDRWGLKADFIGNVRPISNFRKKNTLRESFTKKISSKKNTDLISKPSFVPDDGVYILHETLGVKTVEGWNTKFNEGVVGILLIEDDHKIVVALEDSPKNLLWSKERKLVNQPIKYREDAESDFNGEEYCRNLNSPDFPAAYFCLNYKKGGRDWYLPSVGELWLIYRHREEVQNALSIVGGQKFVTTWDGDLPCYWSSTDKSAKNAWDLGFHIGVLTCGLDKVAHRHKVRPVSNFRKKNTLKESFTKKISSKKNSDLVPNIECPDGVYILHETLGVRGVDGWKPKDNDGVIGILLIEDDHKIVVALEDSPKRLRWSDEYKLVNHPIKRDEKDAESDFNGEEYCRNLNSPDFPAAYYCLNYNKDGRSWYLPSTGELCIIYRHLEEIQTALSIVGGQKFVTKWKGGDVPWYWSSTEERDWFAWILNLNKGTLDDGYNKYFGEYNVRPVSKFKPSELRESFTKKIKNKSSKDLTDNQSFQLENGLYIFHETLGVQDAETWDSQYNKGVVGILLIHDEHKFVVSVDVSPKLYWSEKNGNFSPEQYRSKSYALGDYDSESNSSRLNSPEFPAAYYCYTYKKGGRKWRLGSLGEMSLLMVRYRRDFDRILEKVGAVNLKERAKTSFNNWYWTSTEYSKSKAWTFYLDNRILAFGAVERYKTEDAFSVIPISTFEYDNLGESFTHRVSRKRSSDLVSDIDYPDGVYILHETLGVKTVEGWNPKNNDGVVGVLVVEDEHKIVVALEDAPENLHWSKNYGLFNQSVEDIEDAESDFNGEQHCLKFNSLIFPAAYYCLHYKKGGREWYLPSSGELWMIYRYLDEIQTALSVVGGQKLITTWDEGTPLYWSSTENSATNAWLLYFYDGYLKGCGTKVGGIAKVRPVSIFTKNENLKESFTKKTTTKGRNEIIGQSDNLVVDYENIIKSLIKKYGFNTIHKYVLSLSRGTGYKEPPYVRRHEPFTEDKMVTILGELEFDKSETSDNDIKVTWRKTKKFHYRSPIEKTEKFSELPEEEKRVIYKYLLKWLKRKN